MSAATLMIMGTHSDAGKSMLATALCRIFARRGYRVKPFKAQNMALNAGVTPEGHEIGRSTIAQAEAAGVIPEVDMNPILLKPEPEGRSQLVLNGRYAGCVDSGDWHRWQPRLWRQVRAALRRLRESSDLVIIEGAGSPAEINLKEKDIVNMRVAREAGAPVLLVGDIDRGGVFAALVGTLMLLDPEERERIQGLVINKLRGDLRFLGDGLRMLEQRAFNKRVLGVVPFLPDIGLPAEDSVGLTARPEPESVENGEALLELAVIRLPHIANFDDFDPLAAEPGVRLRFVEHPGELDTAAAVILPGTKATLADLNWLVRRGLAARITELARAGTPVVGICGGYQMMGRELADPEGVEAAPGACQVGLGLLPIRTTFGGSKQTLRVLAVVEADQGPFAALRGTTLTAYEIHLGRSELLCAKKASLFRVPSSGSGDGTQEAGGLLWGTYLHGLFEHDALRHAWLRSLGWRRHGRSFDRLRGYDRLADHVSQHLDMAAIEALIPRRCRIGEGELSR